MALRNSYPLGSGFSIGVNLSYDDAFDGRVSADILYRGATSEAAKAPIKKARNAPTMKGLSDTVQNRVVRVHDLDCSLQSASYACSQFCPPPIAPGINRTEIWRDCNGVISKP